MKTIKLIACIFFVLFFSLQTFAEEKRYNIPIENSPVIGSENAPVTIVEFLDYQ